MRGTNRAEQVDRGGQNVVVVEQAVHAPRPGGALASDGLAPSPSAFGSFSSYLLYLQCSDKTGLGAEPTYLLAASRRPSSLDLPTYPPWSVLPPWSEILPPATQVCVMTW